jgi:hypothetical protein
MHGTWTGKMGVGGVKKLPMLQRGVCARKTGVGSAYTVMRNALEGPA